MKRVTKLVLIAFILAGLIIPPLGCSSETGEAEATETQVATVQRGDLTVDITAAGNLALSHTEDLPIDLFYPSGVKGTVEEVLVEEGDTVEEGQVLVTVDKDEWADQLSALEDQVTAQERNLTQAQINLRTAEQNLKDARDNEAAKKLSLLNAQISLDQANYNLSVAEETNYAPDLVTARADVDKLKEYLQYALNNGYDSLVTRLQAELDAAEKKLDAMIQGYDPEEVAIKKKQVESAKMALSQAQEDLDGVANDIALKEQQVTLNEGKLADAQKALDDAQKKLTDAQSKSPEIKAPFAGFITTVNVEGGDEVLNGTVAVQLADPNRFEADIMVSEMDIMQVKLGGEAAVQVDAMPGLSLPAEITHISPTATIQSGVVNYKVKVEVKSPQSSKTQQTGSSTNIVPEDFQLREGLTVTVNILVTNKENVLLVPNSAITSRGGKNYVKVVSPDGTLEERAIQTGISDWQYIEVISGLREGEKVVVTQGTAAATSGQQGRSFSPMPFMTPPGGAPR